MIFTPRGDGYGMADDPATPLVEAAHPPRRPAEDGDVVTLCGGYRLDPDRTHPLLRDIPAVLHLPAQVGRHDDLRTTLDALGRELGSSRPGGAALVPLLLDMLLLHALRAWFEDRPRDPGGAGWAAALADPPISSALHAIHQDPAHAWTVQSLADQVGLSRAAFARRFNAATRQPPLAYLTWWRLTAAASILRETDAPLEQIAAQVAIRRSSLSPTRSSGSTASYPDGSAARHGRDAPPASARTGRGHRRHRAPGRSSHDVG